MEEIFHKKKLWLSLSAVLAIVVALVISIGFQSLLIWVGDLLFAGFGIVLDTAFALLVISPLLIGVCISDKFPPLLKGMALILFAIMGIYTSIVWFFNWYSFIGCLAILLYGLYKMGRAGAKRVILHGFCGMILVYCISVYYAMLINGVSPEIGDVGINILWGVAAAICLKPCMDFMIACNAT